LHACGYVQYQHSRRFLEIYIVFYTANHFLSQYPYMEIKTAAVLKLNNKI